MTTPFPRPSALTAEQYTEFLTGDRVTVIVGPEAKSFRLQKDILAWASPFMDKAFNGNFKEEKEGVLRLEHVTIKSFELALIAIFAIELRIMRFNAKHFADNAECISIMIDLASLSQILLMPHLDHMASSCLRTLLINDNTHLTSSHIVQAFNLLEDKSGTLELLVDTAFLHFQQCDWDASTNDLTKDWKFGEAMVAAPPFCHIILLKARDFILGRN